LEATLTEFAETLRHYCRNKHCRSKLPKPVSNEREAFCARGCHSSFYLNRCLVCERPIEHPKRGRKRLICKRASCRNAWNAGLGFGRYVAPSPARIAQEVPISIGPNGLPKPGRAWRIVAGPQLSPSAFHCATVPDGPDCKWANGRFERIEAQNRAALIEHFDKLDSAAANSCAVCGREDDLVDHKVADRWLTTCCEHRPANVLQVDGVPSDWKPWPESVWRPLPKNGESNGINRVAPDDSLDIPEFLRRAPVKPPLRLAA
jgi:hypothetical protein